VYIRAEIAFVAKVAMPVTAPLKGFFVLKLFMAEITLLLSKI